MSILNNNYRTFYQNKPSHLLKIEKDVSYYSSENYKLKQHKKSINKIKSYSNNKGKMLLISDLEGCVEGDPKKTRLGIKQSRYMCSDIFFNDLNKFMLNNINNKIAFLGDYFDQGDMFEQSINNIINLKELYKDRIHIILGNRDINKLRFFYEISLFKTITKDDISTLKQITPVFGISFMDEIVKILENLNNKFIIKVMLEKSMGALFTEEYVDYFNDIFNKNKKSNNFMNLFKHGNIIKYDKDFEVLLSHGGGVGTFKLHDINYYKNIIDKMGKTIISNKKSIFSNVGGAITQYDIIDDQGLYGHNTDIVNYFKYIEYARQSLMILPDNYINLQKNSIENIENIINKPLKKSLKFLFNYVNNSVNNVNTSVNIINTSILYKSENLNENGIMNGLKWLCLLQALGLKPDYMNNITEQRPFTSFIQSCESNNCYGPYSSKHKKIFENQSLKENLSFIKNLGVKFVTFGHSPLCAPIPTIFRRRESSIIFISCDTSNGYRKLLSYKKKNNSNELENNYIYPPLPISCISKREIDGNPEYKVGIKYFDENSLTNYNISYQDNKNVYLKQFAPMLGNWDLHSVPLFRDNNRHGVGTYNIVYPKTGKSLHFDAYGRPKNLKSTGPPQAFQPARIIPTNHNNKDTICSIIENYKHDEEEASS